MTADGGLAVGPCESHKVVCVVATDTGGVLRRVAPPEPATMNGVAISPDGRWLTYSAPATNPYGQTQVYLYDMVSQVTTMMSALPGRNRRPALAPDSSPPCLAFEHFELIAGPSVHVTCLTTASRSVEILPAAGYPVWWP